MKKISIYVTGFPGFKSAVIASLGPKWMSDTKDINQELIRFDLPGKMSSEHFKQLIGETTLSDHNILFLFNLQSHDAIPEVD